MMMRCMVCSSPKRRKMRLDSDLTGSDCQTIRSRTMGSDSLTSLSLINDKGFPSFDTAKDHIELLGIRDALVGCDQNMELQLGRPFVVEFVLSDNSSGLGDATVLDGSNMRCPTLKLPHPVRYGGVRDNDENREDELLHQHPKECDHLNGLPLERVSESRHRRAW